MLLYEPPPTQGDLHFRIFGFPVRVHPLFWVSTAIFGISGETPPLELVSWVAVVFVSILVHELGHATLQRYFGGHPWITLHAVGGLATCRDCDRRPLSQIVISLAGPAAGFILAAIAIAIAQLAGRQVGWTTAGRLAGGDANISQAVAIDLLGVIVHWRPFATNAANLTFYYLLFVNILWGLVNLLPIYPLDGGRISRELFSLANPRSGIIASLGLSMLAAGGLAAYILMRQGFSFLPLFFGYLAYTSYASLQRYRASG